MQGTAHVFGDYINTDEHASEKYKPVGTPPEEIQKTLFAGVKPGFVHAVRAGDFLVAGKGFGTVSTRIDASMNIKAVGIQAVLAQSFGMLFYRNAINAGLLCIECDTTQINDQDRLEIDFEAGKLRNRSTGSVLGISPVPGEILSLIKDGGLIEHIRRHGGFAVQQEG